MVPTASIDLNVTPASAPLRGTAKDRATPAAGTLPDPGVLDFDEMPSTTPSNLAFFNEVDNDDRVMEDMIFGGDMYTNIEDVETQDLTAAMAEAKTQGETQADGVSIDEEPLDFDGEHANLIVNLKKWNARTGVIHGRGGLGPL